MNPENNLWINKKWKYLLVAALHTCPGQGVEEIE